MAAESAGIGLWSWNPATNEVEWEDAMCAIFGLPPGQAPEGRDGYAALVHPDDRAETMERISRGRVAGGWESEYRIIRPDGAVRWVVSKARVIRSDGGEMVLGAAFDVTERRARDERLRASQRLEAVGQLTAGIAHNFNNMLMGLLPNLELAARLAPPELVPLLREAGHSGERAANVVRQLMAYAGRNQKSTRRVEAIAPLVERTVAFCRTTFDKGIALDVHYREGALAAVDASQLEQALLNPLINARDALETPPQPAPRIVVGVEGVEPGSAELEGRPGSWVCIRVTDNGVGMDDATVQRVFEPFFTTKEAGKGTGLGLATTQGIVRDHGGFVTCRSAPGQGTTIAMYLPAVAKERVAPEPSRSTAPPPGKGVGSRTTILLVDDEEPVRRVVARVLRESDFDVETAASGEDAIARIADASVAARISAVLLDVSMPGMSGPQLRLRLRDLLPHARVVFLTGYPYQAGGEDMVLDKPLSGEKLVSTLRNLLATP
jgi:PAS domain S-box-containing protein